MSHDAAEDEIGVNEKYMAQCRSHLKHIHDHLSGIDGQPLLPSYFAPSSYWTSAEKEKFFHALCIHSRLRPDLISTEVGSKTLSDVCIYLELLESASSSCKEPRAKRTTLPLASQVSDGWIVFEEEQAAVIAYHEEAWEADDLSNRREAVCKEMRRDMRAGKGEGRTEDNVRDREGEKHRRELYDRWQAEKEREWERHDILRSLDYPRLKVLEAMLREDEENMPSGEGAADLEGVFLHRDGSAPEPRAQIATSVEMIDPVLLAQSQPQASQVPAYQAAPLLADARPFDAHLSLDVSEAPGPLPTALFPSAPLGLPFSPQSDSPDLCLDSGDPPFVQAPEHRQRARVSRTLQPSQTGQTQTLDEEIDLTLSPQSRRRHQKRLYMRRKRAMTTGATVIEHTRKLKPGPKRKKGGQVAKHAQGNLHETEVQETANLLEQVVDPLGENEALSAQDAVGEHKRSGHKGGETLSYRFREELTDLGVDARYLRENQLGLFHLSGLGKLMRLYGSVETESEGAEALSASTVQFLHAHLLHFVREGVQQAIVSREQELRLKMHTKVWRVADDQVVLSNVAHALELMGVRHVDKEPVFQKLLDRCDTAIDGKAKAMDRWKKKRNDHAGASKQKQADAEADHAQEDEDHSGLADEGMASTVAREMGVSPVLLPSSLHREVYAPTVRLPYGASQTRLSRHPKDAGSDDDCLMPSETDEEALQAELQEEEEVDKMDRAAEEEYEKGLWGQMDVDSDGGDSERADEGYGASLRYREPDPNSRIKSQVYVVDSD
ncbi:hypothetical protein OE88DRAFT_1740007 [Heliocybe sulcata]|uniref:Uncharacterized protein n=1 Tax=Heliocybe sulcata TaxID=5364 RepID=A0A5C3MKA2_9AGAM|nr:hypothetical protein OE88DRAFT_1740007 [Heliocybe sulcata]